MIDNLYPKLQGRLKQSSPDLAIQSQGIKLKFADFQQTTVEHKYQKLNKDYFFELLAEGLARQNSRGIRLVGLHVGLVDKQTQQQLNFSF